MGTRSFASRFSAFCSLVGRVVDAPAGTFLSGAATPPLLRTDFFRSSNSCSDSAPSLSRSAAGYFPMSFLPLSVVCESDVAHMATTMATAIVFRIMSRVSKRKHRSRQYQRSDAIRLDGQGVEPSLSGEDF